MNHLSINFPTGSPLVGRWQAFQTDIGIQLQVIFNRHQIILTPGNINPVTVFIVKSVAGSAVGNHVDLGGLIGRVVDAAVIVAMIDRMLHLDTIIDQDDDIGGHVIRRYGKHTRIGGVSKVIRKKQAQKSGDPGDCNHIFCFHNTHLHSR